MSILAVATGALLAPLAAAPPASASQFSTSCILTINPGVVPPGGQTALTLTVIPEGSQTVTGTVTFSDSLSTHFLGTVPLSQNAAELTVTLPAAGSHVIAAQYNPDQNFDPCLATGTVSVVAPDNDLAIAQPANITTDATGPSGATVSYPAPAVTDPDDAAPPTAACSPASGAVFAIGTTTVTCTATDPDDANSPVNTSFTVTVEGAAAQLSDLAQAVQGVGPGTSLADKVAQAQSYLTAGDVADTCGALGAFLNEVNAQSGKHIPASQAAWLLADARRIQAVLGC